MKSQLHYCKNCNEKISRLMNYCPHCGKEQLWNLVGDIECDYCSTTLSKHFNFCYACGNDVSPDEWKEERPRVLGFQLEYECDDECGGKLQEYMSICPWCGEEQVWEEFYGKESCDDCGRNISDDWYYCAWCGEAIDWGEPVSWARKGGYLRPFNALVEMPEAFRDNLRESLNFNYEQSSKFDAEFQAWEIINTNLKGIVARLHKRHEQFWPWATNISWRQILERLLDQNDIYYPAHMTEEELEFTLIEKLLDKRIKPLQKKLNIPSSLSKNKKVSLVIDILKGVDEVLDDLIGSSDKPAIGAVISICLWIHRDKLENEEVK